MVTFNTLRAVQKLRGAGVSAAQAEATIEVLDDSQAQLVTKQDLDAAINGLRVDMWRAFVILGGIIIGAMAALTKL